MQEKKKRKISYACKLLTEWLKQHETNMNQFAAELNCNYINVWVWCHGVQQPSLKFACLIEEKTSGYVPPRAWLILDKSSEPKNAKKKTPRQRHNKRNA